MMISETLLSSPLVIIARYLIGIILLVAAVGKWLDRDRFARAVRSYQLLPEPWTRPVAVALPGIEGGLGFLLIGNLFTPVAALLTCVLFVTFSIAQLVVLARGQQVDCHCFGSLAQEKVGWQSLLRNTVLILMALVVLVTHGGLSDSWSWAAFAPTEAVTDTPLSSAEHVLLFLLALGILGLYLLLLQTRKMLAYGQEDRLHRKP